jgi:hypothetical protein
MGTIIAALPIFHSGSKVQPLSLEYVNADSQIAAEIFLESARLFVSEPQWADNSFERLEMLEKNLASIDRSPLKWKKKEERSMNE